jgi:kynurenine formamidase
MAEPELGPEDLAEAAESLRNWSRWGPDDEVGTLNHTTPDDVISAARLVRKGKVISLALDFDASGPQGARSAFATPGRINPLHVMLRTGTDAYSGSLDHRGIRSADDLVVMPLQSGTQWDGLGHVFFGEHMWNGYDCREVSSAGAQKCGMEKTKARMVGRGVLLDVPACFGMDCLEDGYPITPADLDRTAESQGIVVRGGDYVMVRTGQMEAKLAAGTWDGYPGGDAPGLAFSTLAWIREREIAAVATDTWGCEVRPNRAGPTISQPWHWIAIPIIGLTVGEIFNLADLAEDCRQDGVYEFMFVAPALPITGSVGSPTNPLAIK